MNKASEQTMHPRCVPFQLSVLLLLAGALDHQASAQCILANPSFEMTASGAQVFGGWNQFGVLGSTDHASHGSRAALVSGPNSGDWGVSAYWQSQDCAPGEQWEATGQILNPSQNPLLGQNVGLVNVEWRDAGGLLIDYDSFHVANADSPQEEYLQFSVLSRPAPDGTVSTRILLGILQSPTDPASEVYFDQVTFYSTTPPTMDEIQWNDFPGGRSVAFAGYNWRVKGPGVYGPGNNLFCDSSDCVWVDTQDRLHLTLQKRSQFWYSTEVVVEEALGYGDYIFTTIGRLDLLDPQAILGIFLWQYGPCWDNSYGWWNPYNEVDIEYGRWGDPGADIGQFVAQPWDYPANLVRFDASFGDGELTSHAIRWLPDRVEFRAWRGSAEDETPENLIHSWTYTGPHIPRLEQPRMHLNLWKLEGNPAMDQAVVFTDFLFVPDGDATAVDGELADRSPWRALAQMYPAAPNPFNPSTVIRFELQNDDAVRLDVYDQAGRHVRTLLRANLSAGVHRSTWSGRDDAGRRVASGSYLVRLAGSDFVETQQISLVK